MVVGGFAATIQCLGLPTHARAVGQSSMEALRVLRDAEITDLEKEEVLQRDARRLFGLLVMLAGGSAFALGLPLASVWFLEQIGIGSSSEVLTILQRIDFLLGTTVVGTFGYMVVHRWGKS